MLQNTFKRLKKEQQKMNFSFSTEAFNTIRSDVSVKTFLANRNVEILVVDVLSKGVILVGQNVVDGGG